MRATRARARGRPRDAWANASPAGVRCQRSASGRSGSPITYPRALQPVEHPTSLLLSHAHACHDGRQVPRLRAESPEHLPDFQGGPVPDSRYSIESHTFSSS